MIETAQDRQPPALLKPASVARQLEIGVRTLWRWVSEGTFPPPDIRKNDRVIRWKRQTVEAWIKANLVIA